MEQSEIYWLIENHIIYTKRPPVLTLECLREDSENIIKLLDVGEAPIHIINDTLAVNMTPKKALMIRKALPYLDHPHLGWFVTVTSSQFISFLASIVPQMRKGSNRSNVEVVNSLDEAIQFLREHESNLNWDAALEKLP